MEFSTTKFCPMCGKPLALKNVLDVEFQIEKKQYICVNLACERCKL